MIRFHPLRYGAVVLAAGCLFPGWFHPSARGQDPLSDAAARERLLALRGTPEEQALARLNRQLKNIIIPRLEFRQTTLGDAIEYLRQESRRLEFTTSSPSESGGVNVILGNAVGTPAVSPNIRITLTLERIPLVDALKYVGAQAGLRVKIEPYAVSLVPLSENDPTLKTAVFRVPPSFIVHTRAIYDPLYNGPGPID